MANSEKPRAAQDQSSTGAYQLTHHEQIRRRRTGGLRNAARAMLRSTSGRPLPAGENPSPGRA
jgi:hypothetical protein